jgi:hypothetical protein
MAIIYVEEQYYYNSSDSWGLLSTTITNNIQKTLGETLLMRYSIVTYCTCQPLPRTTNDLTWWSSGLINPASTQRLSSKLFWTCSYKRILRLRNIFLQPNLTSDNVWEDSSYSFGARLYYIHSKEQLDIKQKVMTVEKINSSFNNKHQENLPDGLLQCTDTYDRSYV